MADAMAAILETTQAERLATGFVFTEGPLWHPDGFYYFVDVRASMLYRITPGRPHEVVREKTGGGNGTTFDLQGRLILCEGDNRRVVRQGADGRFEVLVDRFEGKRLNRPNDVVCKSDGSVYFTDPGLRVPLAEREVEHAGVYRVAPDGAVSLVADFEYPNGLAFSPDERLLYVANTRWAQYIHVLELDGDGRVLRRRIFADMSSDETDGVPDGMKVDVEGRVYCTGPGGTWVFAPDGTRLGIIRTPEVPANLAFGGPDLRTLFFTARTSVYTLRAQDAGPAAPVVPAAGPVTGCRLGRRDDPGRGRRGRHPHDRAPDAGRRGLRGAGRGRSASRAAPGRPAAGGPADHRRGDAADAGHRAGPAPAGPGALREGAAHVGVQGGGDHRVGASVSPQALHARRAAGPGPRSPAGRALAVRAQAAPAPALSAPLSPSRRPRPIPARGSAAPRRRSRRWAP